MSMTKWKDNLLLSLLVLWGMTGQVCGGLLWLWLTDIEHRSIGWQWVIGIVGFIPFSLGGIVFILIAAFIGDKLYAR